MGSMRILTGAAALALLAGCTTGPAGTEVTRFHLGVPIARGDIALVPVDPRNADSLEFRAIADAVAAELARQNFAPAPNSPRVTYVGTITVTTGARPVPPKSSFSIGIGGGGFGRGGGVGGGVSLPVGGTRPGEIRFTTLSLQIKRHSDETVVWEGRATGLSDTRDGAGAPDFPGLARALLGNFPGTPGRTEVVPARRR